MSEFIEFPKIARLSRDVLVTEKIDGTNAQVFIDETTVRAGSRNRWLTLEADNFGFCAWVHAHADELRAGLGPGRHFGEWWGSGIQRGYGLRNGEKRWSLFNVQRWHAVGTEPLTFAKADPRLPPSVTSPAPECCSVVPLLWRGVFDSTPIESCLAMLRDFGSRAAPGFMHPEGIVVFHVAAGVGFKKTIDKDGEPKGLSK